MFKTWFYTNIYNVYTNYCLILQIFKVWAVVYLIVILYYIRPICYAVSGWVFTSSCYSFVICLYFYNTSQGHSVDLQLFFIFFAITVPDNIWFIQHFYIFLLLIFVYFIMLKKSACLRGHLLFEKSKMASILLVVLMVCICSDR